MFDRPANHFTKELNTRSNKEWREKGSIRRRRRTEEDYSKRKRRAGGRGGERRRRRGWREEEADGRQSEAWEGPHGGKGEEEGFGRGEGFLRGARGEGSGGEKVGAEESLVPSCFFFQRVRRDRTRPETEVE